MDDLDSSDSARSESGVLVRNRVRQGICRLDLSWRVGGNDAAMVLNAIVPSLVKVIYYDPRTGITNRADMYVEEYYKIIRFWDGFGIRPLYFILGKENSEQ